MNEANYASLEASKRLVDAGIVLETEAVWYEFWDGIRQYHSLSIKNLNRPFIPAPSMIEIWSELPWYILRDGEYRQLQMEKYENETCAHYDGTGPSYMSTNPVDALIDLLIWVKKENIAK